MSVFILNIADNFCFMQSTVSRFGLHIYWAKHFEITSTSHHVLDLDTVTLDDPGPGLFALKVDHVFLFRFIIFFNLQTVQCQHTCGFKCILMSPVQRDA